MKLDYKSDKTEMSDNGSINDMTVKVTPKTFSLLIDKLYQDKHGAIIRELSANAIDAHMSNGNSNVPFEIIMPTEMLPRLVIKDHGCGMTKDEMIRYIGSIMESSKENSDDSIGAYGLGAKTPFSLVPEYMVTSIKNNIKTTMMLVRDRAGQPQYSIVSESKTEEPSGTQVIIEVDANSVDIWYSAIIRQLSALEVKPIVHNYDFEWPELQKYDGFSAVSHNQLTERSYINMGGILYPIAHTYENNIFNNKNSIIYNVNIGDVDVPPDRERLEYTTKTKNKLALIFEQVKLKIQSVVDEQYELYVESIKDKLNQNNELTINQIKHFNNVVIGSFIDDFNKDQKIEIKSNSIYSSLAAPQSKVYNLSQLGKLHTHFKGNFKNSYYIHKSSCVIERAYGHSENTLGKLFNSNCRIIIKESKVTNSALPGYFKFDKNNTREKVKIISVSKKIVDDVYELLKSLSYYFSYDPKHIILCKFKENVVVVPTNKSYAGIRLVNQHEQICTIHSNTCFNNKQIIIFKTNRMFTIAEYDSKTNETDSLYSIYQFAKFLDNYDKKYIVILATSKNYDKFVNEHKCITLNDYINSIKCSKKFINDWYQNSKKNHISVHYTIKPISTFIKANLDMVKDIMIDDMINQSLTDKKVSHKELAMIILKSEVAKYNTDDYMKLVDLSSDSSISICKNYFAKSIKNHL